MGCGSSKVNPNGNEATTPRPMPEEVRKQRAAANGHIGNGDTKKTKIEDSNANRSDVVTNNPVPKSIVFSVTLDGKETDSLVLRHPPLKLKKLAPLNGPTLTAKELEEKIRLADEKREKALQRKISASKKSSKRRRELLMAKEFEEKQQNEQEKSKIDSSLKTAELMREAKLQEVRERQRIREERGRRARERAKKIHQAEQEDLGILEQVEKDNTFNTDDTDSWLNDENKDRNVNSPSGGDRIYSGHSSPQKQVQSQHPPSAGTLDSYNDNAFHRKPTNSTVNGQEDDFFDS